MATQPLQSSRSQRLPGFANVTQPISPPRLATPGREPEAFDTLAGLAARIDELAGGGDVELVTGQASTGQSAERAVIVSGLRGSRYLIGAALIFPHDRGDLESALRDISRTRRRI